MMKINKNILAESLVFVLLCLCMALYYELAYKYHFFWHEQNQIFLLDSEYISHYFDKPAWLACLAGDYLTQFYYYLYVGPIILSVIITFTLWLLYRSLNTMIPKYLAAIITIAAAVWIVGSSLNMFFSLSSVLCFTGGIIAYKPCSKIRHWGVILLPLIYWFFGFGCLVTAALFIINALSSRKPMAIVAAALSVSIVLLTPLVLKSIYTLHYGQALIYPGMAKAVTPEKNFEENLGIENEYYFGNYDKALKIAKTKQQPDAVSAFYYHLINAKRDSLPEYLLSYGSHDLGTLHTIGESTPRPVINMMNDLYFDLGDMTYAERAAMMRNVFSDQNRNVRMIKRLAEINLISGDSLAAKKYLRILGKTHCYNDWAAKYLGADGNMLDNGAHKPSPAIAISDTLRLGDNCRTILIELLEKNPDNTMALDYLLCTDLLLKEMDTFKADYDRYCMDRGHQRQRKLYQEALAIYLAGTDAPVEDWQRYLLPETFNRFREYNNRRRDPAFAGTYWYYFDTTK